MWKVFVPVAIVLAAIGGSIAWKVGHRTNAPSARHEERCPPITTHLRQVGALAHASGHVTKETGTALAGATVALLQTGPGTDFRSWESHELFATTDASGTWEIENVPPGDYVASATASGFLPVGHARVVIAAGEHHAGIDLSLEAGGTLIRGTVSDYDGKPIAGARIDVSNYSETEVRAPFVALTGPDGKYELSLPAGHHSFNVHHDEFTPSHRYLEVGGTVQAIDFKVVRGATIHGVVIARATGKPVAGAIVVASGEGRDLLWHEDATADDEGKFTVRGAPPGVVLLDSYGVGVASAQPMRVGVDIGGLVDVPRLLVEPAVSICGRVVAKGTQNGIAGANVWAAAMGSSTNPSAHDPVRADGAFQIVGVTRGTHSLLARAENQMPVEGKPFEVGDKDVTGVLLEMETGAALTGRVEPPAKASIAIVQQGGGSPSNMSLYVGSIRATSDASGAWRLDHVPPGKFVILASTSEGATGQIPIVVADRDQKDLVVNLGKRASVSGRVVDTKGVPVAGLKIVAQPDPRTAARIIMVDRMGQGAISDANGAFKIVGLEAGAYRVGSGDMDDMLLRALEKPKPLDPIDVAAGADVRDIMVTVEPRDGEIRGVVTLGGKPTRDVWVTARLQRPDGIPAGLDDSEPVLTDANGSFVIGHLRERTYMLVAEGLRAATGGEKTGVNTGDITTIELQSLGTLTGHVTLRGVPVTSYDLECRRGPTEHVDLHSNAADGGYVLDRLSPGHYRCGVSTTTGNASGTVDVQSGAATLNLTLTPWATITGRGISALTGAPIQHLPVTAFSDSGADSRVDAMAIFDGAPRPASDASGRFTIEHVANGTGHVALWDPSFTYPLSDKPYNLTGGERIDIGTLLVPPLRSNDPGTFGIDVKLSGDALEVTTAAPAGPASVAGIVIGDKITAIQGHTITELTPAVAHALVSSGSITAGETLTVTLSSSKAVSLTAAKL